MNKFIDFMSESNNFALVLSSLVSICVAITSTIASSIQSKNQYKEKSMSLYFEAQYKAYTEFYKVASELNRDIIPSEIRDIRTLIAAAKNAELVSPSHTAKIIDNFCAVYLGLLEEADNGEISEETTELFRTSLELVSIYLREELLKYDFNHRESKRIRKKLKKIYLQSNTE